MNPGSRHAVRKRVSNVNEVYTQAIPTKEGPSSSATWVINKNDAKHTKKMVNTSPDQCGPIV
jgi:hypothetical protein